MGRFLPCWLWPEMVPRTFSRTFFHFFNECFSEPRFPRRGEGSEGFFLPTFTLLRVCKSQSDDLMVGTECVEILASRERRLIWRGTVDGGLLALRDAVYFCDPGQ